VGCDIELVKPRSDAFIEDYFTAEERELILSTEADHRPLVVTLLWSAKESALKALRTGLRADTRDVPVRFTAAPDQPDWQSLEVTPAGEPHPLRGFWRASSGSVLTLVSRPAADRPLQLTT
jgi:4'-phosphopantetheinyl transferase